MFIYNLKEKSLLIILNLLGHKGSYLGTSVVPNNYLQRYATDQQTNDKVWKKHR